MALPRYAFGAYELDTAKRTLARQGEPVEIQARAYDLLLYLIERRDRVVSQSELLDALWPGVAVTPSALSRAIHKARSAVGDGGEEQRVIATVHGRGFRFVAETEAAQVEATPPGMDVLGSGGIPRNRVGGLRQTPGAALVALLAVGLVCAWWLARQDTSESVPAHPLHAIAVLPFVDMSPGADQGYLGDGLAEELINVLAGIEGLQVVGRTSAFALRDGRANLRAIGEQLGVGTVVEGSVRKDGPRLRITAQAIRVGDGMHLWSRAFDRRFKDIFAIQREIADSVAAALELEIFEAAGAAAGTPGDLRAYELNLRGREELGRMDAEGYLRAIDYFERAIARDPGYANAYVGLVFACVTLRGYGRDSDGSLLARARNAARRAMNLGEALPEAHLAQALVLEVLDDLDRAEAAVERTLALKPIDVDALVMRSRLLMHRGRVDEALATIDRALTLDPLSPLVNFFAAHLHSTHSPVGNSERAIELMKRTLLLAPDATQVRWDLATSYAERGRDEAALEVLLEPDPGNRLEMALRGAYGEDGMRGAIRVWFEHRVTESGDSCAGQPRWAGSVFAQLGERDRMLTCLRRAVRAGNAYFLDTDTVFDPYRGDPRFAAILEAASPRAEPGAPLGAVR